MKAAPALHGVSLARPATGLASTLAWAAFFVLLIWSWEGADMRPLALVRDSANMAVFLKEFFPPNFHDWRIYLQEMVITIHIAIWGTVLAVICAIPCGLLSAQNLAPGWVYQPMRRVMDACRAINEMIFAMLFIVAVGLGPFAGVMALWVHTTGVLAKLFAEAVEAIDPRPMEGVRATGANVVEEILYGVIPQVLPLWISYSLYRFESNVRSASVLGMVGAGGIGVILHEVIRGFDYAETAAVLLIIIVSVTLIDLFSARIRQWAI
jgi:phosphonate transport system permease protein